MATTAYTASGATRERPNLPFIIGASSVGTLIEWYDFYLYGVLAVFFSKHFFSPALDPGLAFILSLFVFWTGFLVRPFGAIVFGHLGDLIGRKFTFMLTLLLMGAATFVVGLLPGYETIGVAGADPARRDARAAGSGARRRIWRRRDLYRRARARRQARVLYLLDPDHGDDGHRSRAARDPAVPPRLWRARPSPIGAGACRS